MRSLVGCSRWDRSVPFLCSQSGVLPQVPAYTSHWTKKKRHSKFHPSTQLIPIRRGLQAWRQEVSCKAAGQSITQAQANLNCYCQGDVWERLATCGNGSAMGWVTPICHSFKTHLLSTYCVLLTISLGYTVNNIGQCPCSHESTILERMTDNNQETKLRVSGNV